MAPPGEIEKEIEIIVASIKGSKKYRDTYEETIRELVKAELGRHKTRKKTTKAVRKRLHRIQASYVGDPDYKAATLELTNAFQSGVQEAIQETCTRILACHVSTRERLAIAGRFYKEILQ